MASRTDSPTCLPCRRASTCNKGSRPSGIRAVQRVPSAVPASATRSPSATRSLRNEETASRARSASTGARCSSSNTITKLAGSCPGRTRFVDGRSSSRGAVALPAPAGLWTASKLAISCDAPSSVTREVLAAEADHGRAALVGDDDVHGHELGLGRERRPLLFGCLRCHRGGRKEGDRRCGDGRRGSCESSHEPVLTCLACEGISLLGFIRTPAPGWRARARGAREAVRRPGTCA